MAIRHPQCGARDLRRSLSMILLAASTGFAAALQPVQAEDAFIPKLVNSSTGRVGALKTALANQVELATAILAKACIG